MDLFDVNASRCAGSLTVDSSAILEGWLHSNYSYTVLPCVDGPMRSALMATGASVGFHMPKVDTETENLVVAGSYAAARTVGAVLIDGKLKVSFDVIDVSFQPQWANPTWSLLGFSQELEQPQILEAIKLVVTSLPSHSIQWEAASDTQFQWDTWLLVQGRLARGARWWGGSTHYGGFVVWYCRPTGVWDSNSDILVRSALQTSTHCAAHGLPLGGSG